MDPLSHPDEIEATSRKEPWFQALGSRNFPAWLQQHGLSLAFTTYQRNKLFLVGRKPDGQLSMFERTFPRCMGLWTDGQSVWRASQSQIWRLESMLANGELADRYDRLYVPRHGYVTGDLDVHDIAVDGDGRRVFVNTLFSCLAAIDERHNFQPLWRPSFSTK